MRKLLIIAAVAYVIALHVVVALALFRPHLVPDQSWRLGLPPSEPTDYVAERHQHLSAQDATAAPARHLVIGASHTEALDPLALGDGVRTMGAGGATLRVTSNRIGEWRAVPQASTITLWLGYNDLAHRAPETIAEDMRTLLGNLPDTAAVFVLTATPVRDADRSAQVAELNVLYADICADQARCTLVNIATPLSDDAGLLSRRFDGGDGIHLNAAGYATITPIVREAIAPST